MQQTKQNGIGTDCSGKMTRSHGLKSRPQLKSMICLYGKCEGFSRWMVWQAEAGRSRRRRCHHTTKDRSSFRVSGLAVSAVYSPLAFVSSMCTYSAQASQSRAAALSFGIRLLARPTPRQPALRNSGMFSGVKQCSFPGLWQKRESGRFHPGGMKAA